MVYFKDVRLSISLGFASHEAIKNRIFGSQV